MPQLGLGSRGQLVARWNSFLSENGFSDSNGDLFDQTTETGTRAFQHVVNKAAGTSLLRPDGIAGNLTIGRGTSFRTQDDFTAAAAAQLAGDIYPPQAVTLPSNLSRKEKEALFGEIKSLRSPLEDNPEHITITNSWNEKHLKAIEIPQLKGVVGAPASGKIHFNTAASSQLIALWECWEFLGLLDHIHSFAGSYSPRLIRGSVTELSNHAYGTAFDINADSNPLGALPAFRAERGSLFDLIFAANSLGFYWGGHYRSRLDGMHFEVTAVLSNAALQLAVEKIKGATRI